VKSLAPWHSLFIVIIVLLLGKFGFTVTGFTRFRICISDGGFLRLPIAATKPRCPSMTQTVAYIVIILFLLNGRKRVVSVTLSTDTTVELVNSLGPLLGAVVRLLSSFHNKHIFAIIVAFVVTALSIVVIAGRGKV
jgi:hypothetical protein